MSAHRLPESWPIPSGTRDLLPGEARQRRILENKLAAVFETQGYDEVATPTLEFFNTLAVDVGYEGRSDLYRVLDRGGRLLVLRPDMTYPIARLVSTRLRDYPLPLRLFYLANVFRYELPQAGRLREFSQAGVELIGSAGPKSDGELIALAVEALRVSGLKDFRISLGQVEIMNSLIEELNLPEGAQAALREALTNKDLVGLETQLVEQQVPTLQRECLLQISSLYGTGQILQHARSLTNNPFAHQAIDYLEQVWTYLEKFQVDSFVRLDLGVLRDFDYYTGIVFEGYTSGLGSPLCGGGRYDNLLGKFGFPCPATGFALGIERLIIALTQQDLQQQEEEG